MQNSPMSWVLMFLINMSTMLFLSLKMDKKFKEMKTNWKMKKNFLW